MKFLTLLLAVVLMLQANASLALTTKSASKTTIKKQIVIKKSGTKKATKSPKLKGTKSNKSIAQGTKKIDLTPKSTALKRARFSQRVADVEKATKSSQNKVENRRYFQTGVASYYANMFNGRRTANGEIFNNQNMTAAHRTLPFGTMVEVTNLRNGRKVIVRINDRGPYVGNRVIDLSKLAASKIGMVGSGLAKVKLNILVKK